MKRQYFNGNCYKYYFKDPNFKTLVLIHGLGLNQDVWTWLISLFKNCNVLIYDLLGHGDSNDPDDEISLALFADQLSSIVNYLDIKRSILVGFSLGSMISRKFASIYPGNVEGLVLLNSPNRLLDHERDEILKRARLLRDKGPESTTDAAIERWFSNEFQQNNSHIVQLVRNWVNSNKKEVYSKIYPILYYGSIDLKSVNENKPSLIITCDQDFSNGPDAAKEIAKNFTKSDVCILKNLRHMALVEDYKKVFSKIDSFIASVD
ncbi:alpha/beta hydrolase [Paracoccaceae bacterium]|nr:alpha/beta hydrolase [Paracoccaceae bacterium]